MDRQERNRALEAAWNDIRVGLGELGLDLDSAREWVGDRSFLMLCNEFDPGEIIIACGVANAAELLDGYGPRNTSPRDPHDVKLEEAVAKAHAVIGPSKPRSVEDIAAARAFLDQIIERERGK